MKENEIQFDPRPEEETSISEPTEEAKEKEQTPEEILVILEEALEKGTPVDLVILSLNGEAQNVPDILVDEINEGFIMATYFDYGRQETGEGIPLEISRIAQAKLRGF